MLERDIEKALVERVRELGGKCEKFVSPGRRSVPDRLVSLPYNIIIFVELKAPGKKPTPKQAKDHASRRGLGCDVRVIDSIEQVNRFPKL